MRMDIYEIDFILSNNKIFKIYDIDITFGHKNSRRRTDVAINKLKRLI
jgi:hypothetical protein